MARRAWVLACAALVAVGPGLADTRSDALIKKAGDVAEKTKSLQAALVMELAVGSQVQKGEGSVWLLKPNYARIQLRGIGPGEQQFISDGKSVFRVVTAANIYSRQDAPAKGTGLLGLPNTPVDAFFDPATLAGEGRRRYGGTIKAHGRTYETVLLTATQAPRDRKLFFGPIGFLEGVELSDRSEGDPQTLSVWLRDVKLNVPLEPKQFEYSPLANFEMLRSPETSLLPLGQVAQDFDLPQPGGGRLSLEQALKGKKAVLINFWFYG